jgi:glycerol kinase
MVQNINLDINSITASGGGSRPPLLQFIADLINIPVGHTILKDRTALGVFQLIGGENISATNSVECDYYCSPEMSASIRDKKIAEWHAALLDHDIT